MQLTLLIGQRSCKAAICNPAKILSKRSITGIVFLMEGIISELECPRTISNLVLHLR